MNRRRLIWLSVPLALIGSAIAAWFVLGRRDADFVTVVPKTRGLYASYAALDATIDVSDFHDCNNVREAFARLEHKLVQQDQFVSVRLDDREIHDLPFAVQFPAESQGMTVKQFLRMTMRQAGVKDFTFIVGRYAIQATTSASAEQMRIQNLDSVTLFDRLGSYWQELTGAVDDDPPTSFFHAH